MSVTHNFTRCKLFQLKLSSFTPCLRRSYLLLHFENFIRTASVLVQKLAVLLPINSEGLDRNVNLMGNLVGVQQDALGYPQETWFQLQTLQHTNVCGKNEFCGLRWLFCAFLVVLCMPVLCHQSSASQAGGIPVSFLSSSLSEPVPRSCIYRAGPLSSKAPSLTASSSPSCPPC